MLQGKRHEDVLPHSLNPSMSDEVCIPQPSPHYVSHQMSITSDAGSSLGKGSQMLESI